MLLLFLGISPLDDDSFTTVPGDGFTVSAFSSAKNNKSWFMMAILDVVDAVGQLARRCG